MSGGSLSTETQLLSFIPHPLCLGSATGGIPFLDNGEKGIISLLRQF
jgi:hypothetical protein